jgi:hypothetical protein
MGRRKMSGDPESPLSPESPWAEPDEGFATEDPERPRRPEKPPAEEPREGNG